MCWPFVVFRFFAFSNPSSYAPFYKSYMFVTTFIRFVLLLIRPSFFFKCVCVCLQSICKSIMSERNHLSFILPTKYKPKQTFSLCTQAFNHVPSISSICLGLQYENQTVQYETELEEMNRISDEWMDKKNSRSLHMWTPCLEFRDSTVFCRFLSIDCADKLWSFFWLLI